jgi:hypothetical protein
MHYGDDQQLDQNSLEIVIYTHGGQAHIVFELASIQKCQFIRPQLLKDLFDPFFFRQFAQLADLEREKWFLLRFMEEDDKLVLKQTSNVSKSDNEFHRLHPGLIF